MISYHFLNQTSRQNFFTNDTAHGAGQLWSQIPQIPAYQNYLVPFPIVVADSRPAGSNSTAALSLDSVVYEVWISLKTRGKVYLPSCFNIFRSVLWRSHPMIHLCQWEWTWRMLAPIYQMAKRSPALLVLLVLIKLVLLWVQAPACST